MAGQHAHWKDREWLRGKDISSSTIKQMFGKLKCQKLYHETYPFLILADDSVVGFHVCFKLFMCLNDPKEKNPPGYLATDLKIPAKKANVQCL